MLRLDRVVVRYGERTAVRGVDLTVRDGRVLALLGPSGCGKSTLLRAVAGLEPLASGQICWDDIDLARIPLHRRGFGLMFQDGVLFPHRTVAGNIAYGLRASGAARSAAGPRAGRAASAAPGAGRADRAARVDELLTLVGLPGYGPRAVDTLSGGEAQRVALARALAPRPRLLLLDEPLAALDQALRERLLADLRAVLQRTRTTALFVTHDQHEAFAVADDVAVMRDGAVQQVGPPEELWAHPRDEWVARFVGYTSVLTNGLTDGLTNVLTSGLTDGLTNGLAATTTDRLAAGTTLGEGLAASGGALALRPRALLVDPAGALMGRCVSALSTPDGVSLVVDVPSVGRVQARGGPGVVPAPGDEVPLRFDPTAAAVLPRA